VSVQQARLLRDRPLAELSAWIIDQHSVPDLGELQHIDTNEPFSPEDSLSISLQVQFAFLLFLLHVSLL
jgi:hypothetical protein